MIRSSERVRLIYHLRVFDAAEGTLLGHLVDITPEGFLVIGENPVAVPARFSLRMDLPRNVMRERRLTFQARSKWCRRDGGGDFYSTGFRIEGMSAESLGVVRRLIRDFYQVEESGDGAGDGLDEPPAIGPAGFSGPEAVGGQRGAG